MTTSLQMENQRNQAIASAVANRLPEDWNHAPNPSHWAGIIDGPEGMRLILGRNEVRGQLPDLHGCHVPDEESKRCRIGVSLTREPKAIAREITRRLLPGHMEVYRDIAARANKHRTAKERAEALADKARRRIPRNLIPTIRTSSGCKVRVTVYLNETQIDAVTESLGSVQDEAWD